LIIIPKIGYPLVNIQKTTEKHHFLMGKSSITWLCSIAMLVYQRVILWSCFSAIFRHTMIHRAMGWNMSKPWKKMVNIKTGTVRWMEVHQPKFSGIKVWTHWTHHQ
jgi:hypothetical protein